MNKVYAMPYEAFCSALKEASIDDLSVKGNEDRYCFIEICGEQDLLHTPHHFTKDHPNVLRLLFDDVEELMVHTRAEDDEREDIPIVPMTEEQGKQIIEFLKANKGTQSCFVHCAAGVSRSGAVATFIKEMFDMDKDVFHRNNKHILPNMKVLSTLRNLYATNQGGKGEINEGSSVEAI